MTHLSTNQNNLLNRKPSKQLRDNNGGMQIKNMFIHKAAANDNSSKLDFDNRYTMEVFKKANKPPVIGGGLQTKANNATAKLYANFDYKKSQQKNKQMAIAEGYSGNESATTVKKLNNQVSNRQLVKIPPKIRLSNS